MRKKIIITDNIKFLKASLASSGEAIAYSIMADAGNAGLIREYLSARPDCFEASVRGGFEENDFIKKYSDFIDRLNTANADIFWWAMNFTNKNPLLTGLYNNVYNYLNLIKLIKNNSFDVLVIISSDKCLVAQVRSSSIVEKVDLTFFISGNSGLKQWFRRLPLLLTIYACARLILRRILSHLFIGPVKAPLKKDYIIATQFENNSFDSNGVFHDTYFGRLKEFFKKENKSYLVCGYTNCAFKKIIKSSSSAKNEDAPYPFECFITLRSILQCLARSVFYFFVRLPRARYDIGIEGENVSRLIKDEISMANNSGQVFVNLAVYYCLKDLLRVVSAKKIFYPFENRSWEKMILLAARDTPRGIKLIGYQHASLTPRHINFIMEDGEVGRIPFPDEIIATGYIAKDILVGRFNFPENLVKVGCALRQTLPQPDVLREEAFKKNNRILLALASSIDEYVGLLKFLDSAFDKSLPYTLAIRPHPALDFRRALKIYRPRNIKYELDNFSLYDSLKISDIIIYASSTVSMEAVSIGIPVVNIRLEGISDSDPMFNMPYLKWVCANPKELGEIIEGILRIDRVNLTDMRNKARRFAESYFIAASRETIGAFL